MTHLWVKNDSERWAVLPLEADAYLLTTDPPGPWRSLPGVDGAVSNVVLLCQKGTEEDSWILVAGREREVRINGDQLTLGVHTVLDRDEIQIVGTGALYFSTECLARIEVFPGSAERLYCPRCKQAVEPATTAVKCPQCRTWYHQADDLPCWLYAETCGLCPQPTDFKAGFRWTPEEL
jgi:Zn finger protein HypA/HybF involved in hydrogenase expression